MKKIIFIISLIFFVFFILSFAVLFLNFYNKQISYNEVNKENFEKGWTKQYHYKNPIYFALNNSLIFISTLFIGLFPFLLMIYSSYFYSLSDRKALIRWYHVIILFFSDYYVIISLAGLWGLFGGLFIIPIPFLIQIILLIIIRNIGYKFFSKYNLK